MSFKYLLRLPKMFSFALIMSNSLFASDPWTTEQKWAEAAYFTITSVDMLQTIQFRSDGHAEGNPVLGKYPSKAKVIVFISASMALHAYITNKLPSKYRKYWQYLWIGIEASAVSYNHFRAGVRIHF